MGDFAEVLRFIGEESIYVFMTIRDIHKKEQNIIIHLSVIHIHMMRMVADGLEIGEQGINLMIK